MKPKRLITGHSKYLLESSTGDVIVTNDLQLIEKLFSLPNKRIKNLKLINLIAFKIHGIIKVRNVKISSMIA